MTVHTESDRKEQLLKRWGQAFIQEMLYKRNASKGQWHTWNQKGLLPSRRILTKPGFMRKTGTAFRNVLLFIVVLFNSTVSAAKKFLCWAYVTCYLAKLSPKGLTSFFSYVNSRKKVSKSWAEGGWDLRWPGSVVLLPQRCQMYSLVPGVAWATWS